MSLIGGRRTYAGSMIGGIAETQEMLDFCAEHGIGAEVEVIAADQVNEAYERVLASDVRYRFVIDTATLRDVGPPARPSGRRRPAGRAGSRLPLVVYVLAVGTFLMLTTEFVVAGLLPEIAGDLHVSVARAGLLITVFAVGMIVGAPTMALLTRRTPRRVTLMLALAVFAVGHVVVALSCSFPLLLAARFVTAWATGAFWSVASVVATRAAGPAASSRALGIVGAGGMLANVVGVPIGAFAGQLVGLAGAVLGPGGPGAGGRRRSIARHVPHEADEPAVSPSGPSWAPCAPAGCGWCSPPARPRPGACCRPTPTSPRCSPTGPASRRPGCRWCSSASASAR